MSVSFPLESVCVEYGLNKGLRSFLWQVVPDAARNDAVLVLTRKLVGVSSRVWMWRAIGIALQRDAGNADHRSGREPRFQIVILRRAFGESEPPTIVMD